MSVAFDALTCKDYILSCCNIKEGWARQYIKSLNARLSNLGKSQIILGLIDVIPPDLLFSQTSQIVLHGYTLQNKTQTTCPIFEIPKSFYGIYYMPNVDWHRKIKKSFNCFINRNDPIRQSWFYLLYNRKYLDNGCVSFSGHSRLHNQTKELELFDHIHHSTLSCFDSLYHNIRALVPYKNFQETGNLCDIMLSTKFSLVLETYFDRTDALTFSEKIFRVLQVPRPWLLFHATGTIKVLRDLGFYVYDDIIDHSYDNYDTTHSSVQRQESILNQMEKLIQLEITDSMFDHWEQKTRHNRKILQDWNQSWQNDFLKVSALAYDTALQ